MIATPSVLTLLRDATDAQHTAVEQQPCFAALISRDVTQNDVLFALQVFHRHYAVWEPLIHASLAEKIPATYLEKRRRLLAIQIDLSIHQSPLPAPCRNGRPLAFAEALGWLYVHEGASHGALVIKKSLARNLDADFAQSLTFFAGYGQKTAQMWSETKALLDAHLTTQGNIDAAIKGAQCAFTALSRAQDVTFA